MGGNIFPTRTRRATQDDKTRVLEFLTNTIHISILDVKFIGSSASTLKSKTFGDIDVAVRIQAEYLKDIYITEIEKYHEVVINMGAAYVLFGDVQVDINFIDHSLTFDNWILPASTVPLHDPFKALYRNEILFQIMEYFYPSKILKIEDGRVHTFERPRYTIMEGLRQTTYTYKSLETGNWLSKPVKISDTYIERGFDFNDFMRKIFNITDRSVYDATFVGLLDLIRRRIGSRDAYFLLIKVRNGLLKKKVEIPTILADTIEELEPWK